MKVTFSIILMICLLPGICLHAVGISGDWFGEIACAEDCGCDCCGGEEAAAENGCGEDCFCDADVPLDHRTGVLVVGLADVSRLDSIPVEGALLPAEWQFPSTVGSPGRVYWHPGAGFLRPGVYCAHRQVWRT